MAHINTSLDAMCERSPRMRKMFHTAMMGGCGVVPLCDEVVEENAKVKSKWRRRESNHI